MKRVLLTAVLLVAAGCAGINFNAKEGEGLTYYESKPYLLVATSKDCVSTATVVAMPSTRKTIKFNTGYGSSALSVAFNNGMITTVGQTVDTKIPETITAVASLGTAASGFSALAKQASEEKEKKDRQIVCKPAASLLPIVNGVPDPANAVKLPTPELTIVNP